MTLPLLLLLAACDEPAAPAEAPAAPAAAPVAVATPDVASNEGPRVPVRSTTRVAARHLLVSWAGSVNALPNVTRTKEEARARAQEARGKILGGADFAAVAKAYSDDASGARGGDLGGFEDGTMVKPFEDAVHALKVGELSDLVETPFGFHVIQREPLVEIKASHLIVTWAGAERAPAGVGRSKEEAKARAEAAVAKLQGGAAWTDVVREFSDGPAKDDAGDLGWFGRGQLAPALDNAAFDLDIGATSGVVETPRGYHILRRAE